MKRSQLERKPAKRSRGRICERCGEEFYDRQASSIPQRFCSQRCSAESLSERVKASYPPKDEVVRLYVTEGLSDKELGLRFGHTYQWALGVRQHYGILGRPTGSRRKKPLSERRDRARWGIHLKPEMWCRNCGEPGELHLHHAVPRSMSKAAKYDLRNGIPLCTRCHLGWHHRRVTLYRDIFAADEWAFLTGLELLGQEIGAWLDDRYPAVSGGRDG